MVKQYLNYFKWLLIITGVLAVICICTRLLYTAPVRGNTECLTAERVFDYADVLTDEEEASLRGLITQRELQTGCDIVLVTLEESLKEYARKIEPEVSYDQFVRVYAEEFYDSNKYGFDKPIGDGVILVDNWYREDDGKIYTWLCTTGRAKEVYSSEMIDTLLDNVYEYVEDSPYEAYKTYINDFYYDMSEMGAIAELISLFAVFVAAVAMIIFIIVHWSYKKGKKTTIATTYVSGGKPTLNKKEDSFINKVVTRRHIERSSGSSGGSGGSGGSSGGSHGGGGHSR